MRGVSPIVCEDCRQRFGGWFTFTRHRPPTWDRCRTPSEMRAIGLHRNRRRLWVRSRPTFQSTLDLRATSRVRSWFGKPYRALSHQERQEYRRRLGRGKGRRTARTTARGEPRNAQRRSRGAVRGAA